MIKYIKVYTVIYAHKKVSTTFTSNQALSTLQCRRVSHPRLSLSSRAAFFLSVVSLTVRPPRRGLPRPNCHSQGLTSYTLLPRLPSAAAESAIYCDIYADRGRVVKADIPCSLGGGRRGFDPRQLQRTKRAFFQPLAI